MLSYMCEFMSGLSLLFSSVYISVFMVYHTFLTTVALEYILNQEVWCLQLCSSLLDIFSYYGSFLVLHEFYHCFFYFYKSIFGPRRYYAKWNKSDKQRNVPHDITYIWNLKSQINKQNRNRLIDTENKLMVAKEKGVWGPWWKKMKGLRSTNWALTGVTQFIEHQPED